MFSPPNLQLKITTVIFSKKNLETKRARRARTPGLSRQPTGRDRDRALPRASRKRRRQSFAELELVACVNGANDYSY